MGQPVYDLEDSIDAWTLTPGDHARVAAKSQANRLAFAVLLLFFRANGRFPEVAEIHPSVAALVAQQLGIDTGPIADQAWQGRTGKRHRAEIRILFVFREPTVADAEAVSNKLGPSIGRAGRKNEPLSMSPLWSSAAILGA